MSRVELSPVSQCETRGDEWRWASHVIIPAVAPFVIAHSETWLIEPGGLEVFPAVTIIAVER